MLILLILGVLLFADLLLFTFWDRYVVSFFLLIGIAAGAFWFVPEFTAFILDVGIVKLLTVYLPVYLGVGVAVATVKWIMHLFKVAGSVKALFKRYKQELPKIQADPTIIGLYGDQNENSAGAKIMKNEFTIFTYFINQRGTQIDDWRLKEVLGDNDVFHRDINTREELIEALIPQAKKNVGRITFWALQWPITVISTLVEDVLIKLGKHLSRLFDYLFNRLARKIITKAFG